MKKLIKTFSLIGVFTLCLGMTLLTTNKTNVKAQTELSATVYLPIMSGFYVYNYDYPNEQRLFYLYNTLDSGGKYYNDLINFGSNPSLPGEIVINTSMEQLIERTPREINDVPSIKQTLLYNLTIDAPISIVVKDFWVFDVSTWFKDTLENYLDADLYYIQHYSSGPKITIGPYHFSDLLELSETQLKQFSDDISNAVIDNADIVDADFIYNQGWNVGYDIGYEEGFDDGYDGGYNFGYSEGHNDGFSEGYEEGLQDVHSPTPVEYFLYEFDNWIIPAIAVAVFGGGLFMLFSRKREV